jgi:hypothetical protein
MDLPPPLTRFTLILPAGGNSTRFGSNKLVAMLGGEPVIARTLRAFLDHPLLAKIIIATGQPNLIRQVCVDLLEDGERRGLPLVEFAPAGATRAESVANALAMAPQDVEWVAVHDASGGGGTWRCIAGAAGHADDQRDTRRHVACEGGSDDSAAHAVCVADAAGCATGSAGRCAAEMPDPARPGYR